MEDRTIHEIFSGIAPIIVGTAIVFCLTWVIVTVVRALKERANQRNRIELYSRMLDKFGAAPEFVDYLRSEGGMKFIEESTSEKTAARSPMYKILTSIQVGVVAVLFGAGLLGLANIWDRDLGGDLFIVLGVAGTVGVMVGAGLLISTYISYKLCQKWGLLDEKKQDAESNA